MLFLQISRHTAESCPMHNEKTKKIFTDFMNKMEQLARKHGIKIVGSWASMPDHLTATIIDVPTLEAMTKFSMDPAVMEFMSWQTTEFRQVMSIEDAMKFVK